MEICKKLFFILFIFFIFSLISNYANSSQLNEKLKSKKISYLEFILNNLENKVLLRSGLLVRNHGIVARIHYESIGTQVMFIDKKNKILINIKTVMDRQRYTKKRYKPKRSDCNIVRNLIFFNKYGYSFFQKKNKYLTQEIMEEYFINNFLNNIFLNKNEINDLINSININIEIISPIKGHNFYCSGNLLQNELR